MTPFTSFQLPSGGVSRDPGTDEDAGNHAHTHTRARLSFCRIVLPSVGACIHEGVGGVCSVVCAHECVGARVHAHVCVLCARMSV